MGRFIQKISYVVSSNQMRVNFLAINFELARWLHEVVLVVLCCGSRGRRGELPGPWYYICTGTIGRKCVLLTAISVGEMHEPSRVPTLTKLVLFCQNPTRILVGGGAPGIC